MPCIDAGAIALLPLGWNFGIYLGPAGPLGAQSRAVCLGKMTGPGRAPEPFELLSLRADLDEAQQRIDRATRQLELAAELEARLATVLQAPSVEGVPLVPSAARQTTELEATGVLLEAELRAAEILDASAGPVPAGTGSEVPSMGSEVGSCHRAPSPGAGRGRKEPRGAGDEGPPARR